jgi:hypothetical protein
MRDRRCRCWDSIWRRCPSSWWRAAARWAGARTPLLVLLVLAVAHLFNGCNHGPQCKRCLPLAALFVELGITEMTPISLPEEPWLSRVGDLDNDQVFAVAVGLLITAQYVASVRTRHGLWPVHMHAFAAAGCGKTTVLNVIA